MEILVGTNPPIKHRVFWKGEPSSATSLPVVSVYDITSDLTILPLISPTEVIETITSESSSVDDGVYLLHLPLSITNRNRTLKIVWAYQVEGTSISQEQIVSIEKSYVDLTLAADSMKLGFDYSDPNNKTHTELIEAERYARKVIEAHTQEKFSLLDKIPNDVELAAIELMKDYFSKDRVWKNKYIKQIQTFDWSFEFNSSVFSGTGNAYADQLLAQYVKTRMFVI